MNTIWEEELLTVNCIKMIFLALKKNPTFCTRLHGWGIMSRIQYYGISFSIKFQITTRTLWFLGSRKKFCGTVEKIWSHSTNRGPRWGDWTLYGQSVPSFAVNETRRHVECCPPNRPAFSSYLKLEGIHSFLQFWHPNTVTVTMTDHVTLFQWKPTSV